MSLYIGTTSGTKKVSKLFIGQNGTAREVKTAYAGVNSSLNKVYTNPWFQINPVDFLKSGQITTADIGKTVYLSNSAIDCQEWRVADVNHDGTSGTVDLFSKYTLETSYYRTFGKDQYYANSYIRTWLNGTVLGGFTAEIQNAMKVQNFPSNGTTLSDKVKCPSLNEVGCNNNQSYCIVEGTIYPIFGTQQSNPNTLAIYSAPDGETTYYWTRSRYTDGSSGVWRVHKDGSCGSFSGYSKGVACIRF